MDTGILNLLLDVRLKRILFYNIVIIVIAFVFLDCFESVDGKKRRRKRKRNRGTPQMIIFNLDETLWPFRVDKVITPPINTTSVRNQIIDRVGRTFSLFPDVENIFQDLEKQFYMLGVISQSTDVEKVENLLRKFDIIDYLNIHEIFPGSKTKLLERISERSGVDLEDILYFDSDPTDFPAVNSMNVTTVLVDKNGITVKTVISGLQTYNVTRTAKQNETVTSTTTFTKEQTQTEINNSTTTTTLKP